MIAPGSPPVRATGTGRGDEGMAISTSILSLTSISISIWRALVSAAVCLVVASPYGVVVVLLSEHLQARRERFWSKLFPFRAPFGRSYRSSSLRAWS